MEALQAEMETNMVTRTHLFKEVELETTLQRILRQEAEVWRLRSRILWLQGGIKTQNFFRTNAKTDSDGTP